MATLENHAASLQDQLIPGLDYRHGNSANYVQIRQNVSSRVTRCHAPSRATLSRDKETMARKPSVFLVLAPNILREARHTDITCFT